MRCTITCSCGHTEKITIYGKSADRERRIEYLKQFMCSDCLRKENLHTLEEDVKAGMCDLVGTDKQRPYAATIRHDQWEKVKEWVSEAFGVLEFSKEDGYIENYEVEQFHSEALANIARAEYTLNNNRSSSWWIDRRTLSPAEMFSEMLKWAVQEKEKEKEKKKAEAAS